MNYYLLLKVVQCNIAIIFQSINYSYSKSSNMMTREGSLLYFRATGCISKLFFLFNLFIRLMQLRGNLMHWKYNAAQPKLYCRKFLCFFEILQKHKYKVPVHVILTGNFFPQSSFTNSAPFASKSLLCSPWCYSET